LDLLLCPGGNAVAAGSRQLQLRLFKNDGKGNFTLDAAAFPQTGMNISVAIANDYNGDGFPDLFIGGRSYPQVYGIDPGSFLFVNDGKGHFTDITDNTPSIKNIGMVTSAVFADVTGDKRKELIIAGEWMTPRIFTFSNNHFEEVETNMSDMYGWWQTVSAADVNGDGKEDLILGNIGENFYLRPTKDHPVKLWVSDFDENGVVDKILTYTVDGKDKPIFLKHDLEDAMPFLKKKNLKHEDYATKSVEELIPEEALKKAAVKQFNYDASIIAINKGNGNFTIQKLPPIVQLSSVNAAQIVDVNQDGFIDLVLGGNLFNFQPQLEQLDANTGDVLINNGKGNFLWTDASQTGLNLKGQLRDIAEIHSKNKIFLVFLQNDETPLLYQLNDHQK
jgi:enediyne biosynthesis protein E4